MSSKKGKPTPPTPSATLAKKAEDEKKRVELEKKKSDDKKKFDVEKKKKEEREKKELEKKKKEEERKKKEEEEKKNKEEEEKKKIEAAKKKENAEKKKKEKEKENQAKKEKLVKSLVVQKSKKKDQGMSETNIVLIVGGVAVAIFLLLVLFKSPVESSTSLDSRATLIQAVDLIFGNNGVSKDEQKGFELLKKAASLGHPEAQHRLGYFYTVGISDIQPNSTEAYRWYYQAALQGVLDSMVNVGLALANGQGVERNQPEAFKWWKKASNRGSPVATGNVGRCYEIGLGTEINLTKAIEFYKKGIQLEDGGSMYHYGLTLMKGINSAKEPEKAIEYFQKAAQKEFLMANTILGELYLEGKIDEKNPKEALTYFMKAAQKGETKSQYYVAMAHANNQGEGSTEPIQKGESNIFGLPYDMEKAIQILEEAAKYGSTDSLLQLAEYYEAGHGVAQNSQVALQYLQQAAQSGNPKAAWLLVDAKGTGAFGGGIELSADDEQQLLMLAMRSEDKTIQKSARARLSVLQETSQKNEEPEESS